MARADILIISILHNDTTWASDTDPCDGNKGDLIDFSKYSFNGEQDRPRR